MRWQGAAPVFGLALALAIMSGCSHFRSGTPRADHAAFDRGQVLADMRTLDLSTPCNPTPAMADYFAYYGLAVTNAQHYFGTVASEGHALAAHVFVPEAPRGSLCLLHGYLDHTGSLAPLIAEGLARDYAVAVWDFPGHGLSSGDRADTGAFDLCAAQFTDLVARAEPHLPRPFHLVAHSTGCSIAMEYLHSNQDSPFEKVAFLAPLVRHEHWGWGKFGYAISRRFTGTIRRREREHSSDAAYLAFARNDPLQSETVAYAFLEDLYAWEKMAWRYPVWPGAVLILQGDKDSVVDWEHNLAFLRAKVRDPEVHLISGARHQLVNEREDLRRQVFEVLFGYLDSEDPTE